MTFIKIIIICALSLSSLCMAETQLTPEKPATGEGEILLFTGLNQVWVHIYQKDLYSAISQKAQIKNRRPREQMILIQLFGVQEKRALSTFSPNDKQQKLIASLNEKLKNITVSMSCIYISPATGAPICELNIEKMNLGLSIIEFGFSTYINKVPDSEHMDKIYTETYKTAKEKGVGIWEPFYGLFNGID